MKPYSKILGAAMIIALASCNNNQKIVPGTYVDLNTGDSIEVMADPETGYAYNAETKKPVYLYVDDNQDTVFTTGVVVNNKLIASTEGIYEVDETKVKVDDEEIKIKYDDYKKKVDGDEYKVKNGDYKKKVDGDEMKIKDGDYKKKVDGDEVKIKDGDTKIKIEDGVVTKTKN
ncbi:hypothetical protein [Daejeonella oryzae]|uniref:hypothetical protein n=1 Tax=Daejeonella oryzae TaxID=1122943 RepID=UPI0003FFD397|nr:hypothetical protein [Daejeonella oryzae]